MPKFYLLTGTLKVAGKKVSVDKKSPAPKPVVELDEKYGAHLVAAGVLAPVAAQPEPKKEGK